MIDFRRGRIPSGLSASRILVPSIPVVAEALTLAAVFFLCVPTQAHAYVDPSVMTYTIQALAGVAVALSAVAGVVWRRVRRHLLKLLHIDENAGKQVDVEVCELNPDAPEYSEQIATANAAARHIEEELSAEKPEQLFWGARFFFALSASIMLCFTVLVVAPLEIVANSGLSLFFTVPDVWVPIVVFGAIVMFVLALLLSLLRGKVYNVCLAIVFALALAAYIQVMFLNAALPPADGSHVAWDQYMDITIISSIIWIALIALIIFFALKKSLLFKGLSALVCLACVIAQAISLGLLLTTPSIGDYTPLDGRPAVTMQGMLEVSSKDNVIMIVLDTYDMRYLQEAIDEDPHVLDEFTGFTCFTNATGAMIPTRYAMSSILTGQTLSDDDKAYSDGLIASWYTEHNLIDDINELGYQTDLYATDIYGAIDALAGKVENIRPKKLNVDANGTVAVLLKCALYRDLPWALKPPFWFYTDEINNAVLGTWNDSTEETTWNVDDAAYYQLLKERGLSVSDIGEKGSFRVLHFMGAHFPYFIDREGNPTQEETDRLEQSLGSLKITSEYLAQLKKLGVYDAATIIVTADHGEWYLAEDIRGPMSPILLVKPAEDAKQASRPVKFSAVPTGHLDLAKTILDAMGGDATAYGGMNVFDVRPGKRTRTTNATSVVGDDNVYTAIKQWEINGDVLDWRNWKKTGKEWPIE